jgi:translation initiation factor IF-3
MSRQEALAKAEEASLDLVEISPNADPPVAKIVDWGKYQYQKMKEAQKNRRNNKQSELKQMRFGMKIGQGDLDIKLRENAHRELGYDMITRIMTLLENDAVMEQTPQMAGRNLSVVIRAK